MFDRSCVSKFDCEGGCVFEPNGGGSNHASRKVLRMFTQNSACLSGSLLHFRVPLMCVILQIEFIRPVAACQTRLNGALARVNMKKLYVMKEIGAETDIVSTRR